ncbi:MAG: hypothetical protein GY777_27575 [Candidatus Brocadiaceae bacterium]|nr:hypothetical protein [Candidatus Brocadiaceae bacterium]
MYLELTSFSRCGNKKWMMLIWKSIKDFLGSFKKGIELLEANNPDNQNIEEL